MCARVCACVRVCVISEIKHPIQDLREVPNYAHLIYASKHLILVMWDYVLLFLCACDVAAC